MVPWRGILLKLISSYKNRDICQVNDFLQFFHKNYDQTSLENVIFLYEGLHFSVIPPHGTI